MKRVMLFLATNLAVTMVLAVVLHLLGVDSALASNGSDLNLTALLVMSTVYGMAGSLISLAMSKTMAKAATGAVVIEQPRTAAERWLVDTVARQARDAGIGMPEVAVYDSPEPNAFATGMNRNSALVAVSTGLLTGMRREEVEAVLGHEVSHVANGDMVTLALIQGVVNSFVFLFSRVIGHFVDRVILKTERGYGPGYFVTVMVAQLVLGVLASVIVAWFSRQREYRADAGGATLAGRGNMVAALERLRSMHEPAVLPDHMRAFGISGGMASLFATHPPLEERIRTLQQAA
ncbi:MAG: protease HtpX [Gammaproteobacteria bacterium]